MATERGNKNPYSAFNFTVEINGAEIAAFQEVSGLDSENMPIEYREGACFAVLGALCQDRIPITIPWITGVPSPAPLAGAWV